LRRCAFRWLRDALSRRPISSPRTKQLSLSSVRPPIFEGQKSTWPASGWIRLEGRSGRGNHWRGRDAKYDDLKKAIEPTAYFPLKGVAQYGCCGANFELRTAATPESVIPQRAASSANSTVTFLHPTSRRKPNRLNRSLFRERLVAHLSSFFSLLALALRASDCMACSLMK